MEKLKGQAATGIAGEKQVLTKAPSKYALKKKAEETVLSKEVAQEQLVHLLGFYNIDIARLEDEQEARALEKTFDHIADLISEGKIEIRRTAKDDVEVVHTLVSGSVVVYAPLGAQAKLAMDKHPVEAHYARIYALMGSLSSLGSAGIEKFHPRDLAVVDILSALFLAA